MVETTKGFDNLRTPQEKLCAGVFGGFCGVCGLMIVILVPLSGSVEGGELAVVILVGLAAVAFSVYWFYELCVKAGRNNVDSVEEFNRQVYGIQDYPPPPPRQPQPYYPRPQQPYSYV